MEKLKSMVPLHLKDIVTNSGPDDLPSTCSALLDYLHPLEHFHQLVQQLTDPNATTCGKDPIAASKWKHEGNTAFAKGDFQSAVHCYTQALRCLPLNWEKIDKHMIAILYVNRASTMQKMGMLKESIRDCSRAIELVPSYSKAWYRRGKVNSELKKYEYAINDMHMALAFENSSSGKRHVRLELEAIMEQSKMANKSFENQQTNTKDDFDCGDNKVGLSGIAEVSSVATEDKGWEIQAKNAVPPGVLVLHEEPYAAVILKQCRDTHCHFCFRELSGDSLPCGFCTIPLYCSENCRERAGGNPSGTKQAGNKSLSEQITMGSYHEFANLHLSENDTGKKSQMDPEVRNWHEHKHECGGMSWAAVLPTEVVLAGRIFIKSIEKKTSFGHSQEHSINMSLCHHYEKMQPGERTQIQRQTLMAIATSPYTEARDIYADATATTTPTREYNVGIYARLTDVMDGQCIGSTHGVSMCRLSKRVVW